MKRPRAPLFLGRAGYRRRRLRDAARMVPVFGAFLLLLPIQRDPASSLARDTAPDGVYLFAIWAGLIAMAAALAPGLSRGMDEDEQAHPEADD